VSDWTFRVSGEPCVLNSDEQQDVLLEIVRLRELIGGAPGTTLAQLNQNPAGFVGEYASLLLEATVRGHAAEEVAPADVRRRYSTCHWFGVSLEVLTAFCEQWTAVLAERADRALAPRRPADDPV